MTVLTADLISSDLLRNQAGPEVYHQGLQLFRWGRVIVEKVIEDTAQCRVTNNRPFEVELTLSEKYLYFRCECRFASKGNLCEHDVAAALAVQEYLRKSQTNRWQNRLNRVIQSAKTASHQPSAHPYLLFFSLQNVSNLGLLSWKILPYQLSLSALPKDLRSDIDNITAENLQDLIHRSPTTSAHIKTPYHALISSACINCPPESVILANLVLDRSRNNFYSTGFPMNDFLSLIGASNSPIFFGTTLEPLQKLLKIYDKSGEIRLELAREKGGLRINACVVVDENVIPLNIGNVDVISYSPFLLLVDRFVVRIDDENQTDFLKNFAESPQIIINENDVPEFLERYYLPLAQQVPLIGDAVSWETVQTEPTRRLYLTETKGELQAQLRFAYQDLEVSHDSRYPDHRIVRKPDTWTLVKVVRKPLIEEEAYRSLSSNAYGLKKNPLAPSPGTFTLRSRTHPVDFLLHTVPLLSQDGFEVFGEERLKANRVNHNKPTFSFNVSSGIDWFDIRLAINFGEVAVSLKDIRRAFRKKECYIKLADGTIGEIPQEWVDQYRHIFELGEETDEGIRLNQHHLTLIDQLASESEQVITDEEFQKKREKLNSFIQDGFSGISAHELPKGFIGDLRPYQKSGYDWLHFLHDFNFGGCLADDMGLGKTIQALVFFQSLVETGVTQGKAILIVVPRSLIANWQREAQRFTPGLNILEYMDTTRPKDLRTFDEYHVVITTYGVMLRDIDGLRHYPFYYVLLDESQLIKNPLAQTTKAARLLNAQHKLVLTGTPVENSTVELWSQFAFLNPGLLGNLEYFRSEFTNPIERRNDDSSSQLLRKLIYPFILRRTKDQVAPELPERNEKVLYSDMEPAQKKLYNRTRDFYRGMLLGMLETDNLNNTRMKVLEGLLRLRQICNHPVLVEEHFRGESGKFELLIETLETLRSEGHKALVFSQFVQMLRLVRIILDERNIPYAYLDGQTQDRQERVDQFQSDSSIPFFLISLRAGGLGLNLTAADYVIHIDPWWNPAVEMQATDRTHRIGQEKPVFVFKMITRDSVEEKIIQLQEKKRDLVDQLITTDGSFFKDLTMEDINNLFS
jgi:non-specific serine/threonine protein kinase